MICKVCNIEKSLEEFNVSRHGTKLHSCKDCKNEQSKIYRNENSARKSVEKILAIRDIFKGIITAYDTKDAGKLRMYIEKARIEDKWMRNFDIITKVGDFIDSQKGVMKCDKK